MLLLFCAFYIYSMCIVAYVELKIYRYEEFNKETAQF